MSQLLEQYQDFALQLLEEQRIEDAKALLMVVGELAIKKQFERKLWPILNE